MEAFACPELCFSTVTSLFGMTLIWCPTFWPACFPPPVHLQKISNGHSKNYPELLVLLSSSEQSGFLNPCVLGFFFLTVNRDYEITNGRIKAPNNLLLFFFFLIIQLSFSVSLWAFMQAFLGSWMISFIYLLITEWESSLRSCSVSQNLKSQH